MPKTHTAERIDKRIPMGVAVQIAGHAQLPGVETTFTENVSARGARVLTVRRWQRNDRLVFASLAGDFLALARVAYCEPLQSDGFAIGLEFLQPTGPWVVDTAGAGGESQIGGN